METTKWTLDPTHSELQFKIKHLMISTVTGQFNKFDAAIESDGDDITNAKVSMTADIDSISTNNEQRDAHLRTGDFFDAENHPQLSFKSERFEKINDEEYKLHGVLTMRGVSRPVVLNVEHGGIVQDPWGGTRTGFTFTGKVNRSEFGVSFGVVAEAGKVMLADEVKILGNVQFVKQVVSETAAA
jgi:polyisoprenoid-binding protein YceI